MIPAEDSIIAVKALSSAAMLAVASSVPGINAWSVPLFGVPLTAITMAGFGAMCSFAWQHGETTRGRLFVIAAASTFVGACSVSVIPELIFGVVVPQNMQPPLAFLCGLVAPWIVPAAKGAIPAFFKGLSAMFIRMMAAKVGSNSEDSYEGDYQPRIYKPRNHARDEEREE